MPCAGFSQPTKWRTPSSSPIPADVFLGFKEFPAILMPPSLISMPPGAHPPPWDPGQKAWSRACPAVGMRDTWHLPAITACLLWPGLADRGAQECSVGGGNSQPCHPPLGPPHGFLLSFSPAWAQCLGIRILDPSLRGDRPVDPASQCGLAVSQLSGPPQKHPSSPATPPYPATWNSSSRTSGALG